MDELAEARAKLVLLEAQERQILEHLCNVRSAVQVQKKRVDELIEHMIPPLLTVYLLQPFTR
ncbi:hypothetical protein BKA82DRAFT_991292 [Pisolithus tinctorius]|uniref:Uncharacterized protein n=1 Tax=Pisolithus tinctorius Marx 270 TaxID=870435 RepID=A0A0C3PY81_PISTI|nr:hypothetical protein BKA82DRAFT_991292 [Pisolithus tinctorius]KIO14536.1 hypothetical protein M404DRAFT_991292 [Pisolithus tinctorius Marx 270]